MCVIFGCFLKFSQESEASFLKDGSFEEQPRYPCPSLIEWHASRTCPWPWPRDIEKDFANYSFPFHLQGESRTVVGSAPVVSTKIRGVSHDETSNAALNVKLGGSTNCSPSKSRMYNCVSQQLYLDEGIWHHQLLESILKSISKLCFNILAWSGRLEDTSI